MADTFSQLEAVQTREDRERDTLMAFVRQVADGQLTKARAIVKAKSLLRDLGTYGVDGAEQPRKDES